MLDWTIACRLSLALWLGIAALFKLRDLPSFRRAVHHYRVLPRWMGSIYAAAVPLAELISSVLLLIGLAVGMGALLAVLLFASFAIAVGINMRRGRDLDCHCFGGHVRTAIGTHTLAVDLSMLLPAAALLANSVYGGLFASGWPLSGRSPMAGSVALGLGYAFTVGLIYLPLGSRRHPTASSNLSMQSLRGWEE